MASCNKCKDVVCENGGTCEDGLCQCLNGFSGTNCEIEDLCITNDVTCNNDGECVDGECDCTKNYYGDSCDDYCVNGTYKKSTGECSCTPGYHGDACDIVSRDAWLADYVFTTNCNTGQVNVTVEEEVNPDDETHLDRITLPNLSAFGDEDGYGVISGDTLWVPSQKVKATDGTKFTVEGKEPVFLSGGDFVVIVKRKVNGFEAECTHTYTRK